MQGLTGAAVESAAGDGPRWPRDDVRTFRVRRLYQARGLTVIEVVTDLNHTKALHWVGIEDAAGGLIVDTTPIATEHMEYVQCDRYRVPPSIVEIGPVKTPFHVSVKVQPANVESSEGGLVWGTDPLEDGQMNCLHAGLLRWIAGAGFGFRVDSTPCKVNTKPQSVRIEPTGKVRLVPYVPER